MIKLLRFAYYKIINFINKYLYYFGLCLIKVKKYNKEFLDDNYQDYLRTIYIISNLGLQTKNEKERERERVKRGAIAELGVYKGRTSKLLHKLQPNRRLYLFDTFEGFSQKDLIVEMKKNYSTGKIEFNDANYNDLKSYFNKSKNVSLIKGYFPDSVKNISINEEFIFVIIDFDLYKPTLDGLSYFWPKMQDGGIIMVHDFDSLKFKGITKAVQEFSKENKCNFTCLPCSGGSAIFVKNKKKLN